MHVEGKYPHYLESYKNKTIFVTPCEDIDDRKVDFNLGHPVTTKEARFYNFF